MAKTKRKKSTFERLRRGETAASAQYGSGLMLVLPFTASQGSVDAVRSVSVVLKNAQGGSESSSGSF